MNEKWLFILDEEELTKSTLTVLVISEGVMDRVIMEKLQNNVGLSFALQQQQLLYRQGVK